MTTTLAEARRHLALTVLLLDCVAPTSLDEAVDHVEEAARVLRAYRDDRRVGGRALASQKAER